MKYFTSIYLCSYLATQQKFIECLLCSGTVLGACLAVGNNIQSLPL